MSKRKRTRKEELPTMSSSNKELARSNESVSKKYEKALLTLQDAIEKETLERVLKNEAYGFILSEGLTEKFLEYRSLFHRTKHQEAVFNLIMEADLEGLWIDE